MAVALKPPVSAKGITREQIESMANEAANLAPDSFASDGETYGKRGDANRTAAKYVRVIESLYEGVKLRSRTWEAAPGEWVFGIRPKSETTQETPPTPEDETPPAPAEDQPKRGGKKS